jgi:hypothetical protein
LASAKISLAGSLASGPLWVEFESSAQSSLRFDAAFCPLGSCFIPKGNIGRHFQSISRNGLILLMSTTPAREFGQGALVHLRLSIWHRAHLPGEAAAPYGLLLHAQDLEPVESHASAGPLYRAEIAPAPLSTRVLSVALGAGRFLNFASLEAPASARFSDASDSWRFRSRGGPHDFPRKPAPVRDIPQLVPDRVPPDDFTLRQHVPIHRFPHFLFLSTGGQTQF